MKLKHLFFALAAALPLFFSCENKEKPLLPTVTVEPAIVNLETGASVQTVSIQAGRDWVVYAKPDWVDAINPESGAASEDGETVTFSVKSNAGNDREGYIVFSTGLARAAFKIVQKGEAGALTPGTGTKEDPYSVAGVLEYLKTLGNNVQSPVVYVKGVVSNITESYVASGTNGNATFYIKDSQSQTEDFYCYRIKYLGNKKYTAGKDDIKVDDQVIICGKVTNYSGSAGKVTPETVANEAYLYSLNGTSEEGQEQTEITDATVAQFIQSDGNTYYRLTGKVSAFDTGHNTTGNYDYMQFNLTDATGTVVVFGFKDRDGSFREWSTKIKNGGTVVLTGTYERYEKNGTVKDEVMNTTIESFTEGQAEEITSATVAQFIQSDGNTYYRLTGKVSDKRITNETSKYWEFKLTDDTGTALAYNFNSGEFEKWSGTVQDNGTVTLTGTYKKYTNQSTGEVKDEIMNITIKSFTPGADIPAVTGTVSDAVAAADGTPVTINDAIVSAVSTKGYFVTDGSKNVLVYKNAEPTVKIGDKVKIEAKKTTYNSLPEIADITGETVISSNNNVPYTAIKDLTTTIDSYTATESDYISATGEVAADGNYWKVTIDGKTKWVSPRFLPATYDLASLSGQKVIITGYVVQITNTYVGIYVNSVALADPNVKYCRVSSKEISVSADATSATFTITANAAWTLTTRPGDAIRVSPASGSGNAEVTATFSANADEAAGRSFEIVLACPDASVNETITINQAKAGAAGQTEVEFNIAALATANSWVNGIKYLTLTSGNVTLTAAGGSNTGKYYTSGNQWRFYQGESAKLTVSVSSGELVSATFTYAVTNTGILLDAAGATVASDSEVSLSGTSAVFSVGNSTAGTTNGQVRFTKIVVVVK